MHRSCDKHQHSGIIRAWLWSYFVFNVASSPFSFKFPLHFLLPCHCLLPVWHNMVKVRSDFQMHCEDDTTLNPMVLFYSFRLFWSMTPTSSIQVRINVLRHFWQILYFFQLCNSRLHNKHKMFYKVWNILQSSWLFVKYVWSISDCCLRSYLCFCIRML